MTHAIDFLHLVDTIVLIKDGEVILTGNYDDIKDDPYLIKIMKIHKSHQKEQNEIVRKNNEENKKREDNEKKGLIEVVPDQSDSDNDDEEEANMQMNILDASMDPSLELSMH